MTLTLLLLLLLLHLMVLRLLVVVGVHHHHLLLLVVLLLLLLLSTTRRRGCVSWHVAVNLLGGIGAPQLYRIRPVRSRVVDSNVCVESSIKSLNYLRASITATDLN